uniref:Wdrepeat proteinlike [Tribolium castaneum] n=1 Tax=Lepeophtheirus salmonis TaxID=72036 RepID=A0A0K2TIQ6_LEPSM
MVLHPYHQGGPGGLGGPPNQGNNPRMMHHHSFTPRYPMKPRGPTTQAALLSQQAAAAANKAPGTDADFDGKRPRKSLMRKTVDYNASFLRMLEQRVWQRGDRRDDRRALQPDIIYYPELLPPMEYPDNPANSVTTKFVKTATNKMRCPIFTLAWTPEGRRLITGASSGEFTLWNGLTFNFETILQAHDSPVRAMEWSHSDEWMVTGDHGGYVKYWQSNMNNVKMFQAHKEAVRSVSFSPTDAKFATSSDDGTVRIWDFYSCTEEKVLRGHGADVKSVDWHPTKGLLASGSKDSQQPIKIWEPRTGQVLATLHAHKNTVMSVQWNKNGNWLLTASRDHLIKLFDIRNTKEEIQVFRGHKKEASTVAWHPVHESLFASGGSDGAIMFWNVGAEKEVGVIEQAHESIIWSLAWHPVGHILCSGSNDHTCKYWTRNRPGDSMRDKYNLNMSTTADVDDASMVDSSFMQAPT